ncbi:UNVERIFIED_CONTAM: hypothetical protein Sangu_2944500, partial [Sesamum angustifolium]
MNNYCHLRTRGCRTSVIYAAAWVISLSSVRSGFLRILLILGCHPIRSLAAGYYPHWPQSWFPQYPEHVNSSLCIEGEPFTWCNHYPELDTIYERLDRACADPTWRTQFPNTVVCHIPTTSSDHAALLIDTNNTRPSFLSKHRLFRFEVAWASSAEYSAPGKGSGTNSSPASLSGDKVRRKQNTSENGTLAITRGETNDITRIKNGNNQWLEKEEDIRSHIEAYFGDIFRSQNPSEEELEKGTE